MVVEHSCPDFAADQHVDTATAKRLVDEGCKFNFLLVDCPDDQQATAQTLCDLAEYMHARRSENALDVFMQPPAQACRPTNWQQARDMLGYGPTEGNQLQQKLRRAIQRQRGQPLGCLRPYGQRS